MSHELIKTIVDMSQYDLALSFEQMQSKEN